MRLGKYFTGNVTPGSFSANKAVIADANSKIEGIRYPVGGLSQAKLVAGGSTTLDGSNPTAVVTGLSSISGFIAQLQGSTELSLTHVLSHTISSGTVSVYAWKSTGGTALIASTGIETFDWVAFGA